jgi:hypothetical protein
LGWRFPFEFIGLEEIHKPPSDSHLHPNPLLLKSPRGRERSPLLLERACEREEEGLGWRLPFEFTWPAIQKSQPVTYPSRSLRF